MVLRALILSTALVTGCSQTSDANGDLGTQQTIGLELVQQRGCPICHQSNGGDGTLSGQTVARAATSAYPANLTPDKTTGIGAWADIEIVRAMRYGVDNQGLPLCPAMPRFDGSDPNRPFMTDVEANAIVAYLRALPAVKRTIPSSMCPPIKPQPPLDMTAPSPRDMAPAHD